MEIVLWALLAAAGLTIAAMASVRGVDHAARAASAIGMSPFLIGITLVALGTDVPEIANSIVASLSGHGDINVGDSIGSAAAQATVVLGAIPLIGGTLAITRRNVSLLGGQAAAVLLLAAALMADGHLGRADGLTLIAAWVVTIAVSWRLEVQPKEPELPFPERRPLAHAALAMLAFGVVAGGATAAVIGVTGLAQSLALPEYLVSFVGQALGTSLPELVVAVTAVRRRQGDLAIGNALGATLTDSSLSLGIGPAVAPTAITAALAVRSALLVAVTVGAVTLLVVLRGRHTRVTGILVLCAYAISVVPLITGAWG